MDRAESRAAYGPSVKSVLQALVDTVDEEAAVAVAQVMFTNATDDTGGYEGFITFE